LVSLRRDERDPSDRKIESLEVRVLRLRGAEVALQIFQQSRQRRELRVLCRAQDAINDGRHSLRSAAESSGSRDGSVDVTELVAVDAVPVELCGKREEIEIMTVESETPPFARETQRRHINGIAASVLQILHRLCPCLGLCLESCRGRRAGTGEDRGGRRRGGVNHESASVLNLPWSEAQGAVEEEDEVAEGVQEAGREQLGEVRASDRGWVSEGLQRVEFP
jgi:hypothetical protein